MKTKLILGLLLIASLGYNAVQQSEKVEIKERLSERTFEMINLQARNDNQKEQLQNTRVFLKSIGYNVAIEGILQGDYAGGD